MAFSLAALSFLSCAVAFAVLALILRPARDALGAPRIRLRLAALATSVWAFGSCWLMLSGRLTAELAHLSTILLMALWLWHLEPLAKWQGQPEGFQSLLRWAGPAVAVLTTLALIVPSAVASGDYPAVLPIAGLMLSSLGLFALEQTYRNASAASLRAVRWFCLGLAGVFLAELVVSAEALLLGSMPVEPWIARGYVFAFCAVAIGRGARRMPDWNFGLSISRHVAFYTTSFVAIGTYLVLMGLAGWQLLRSGAGWGHPAQIGFASLAALTLIGLLYSSNLLRRLRVFINNHFYPHRYDYRREWLRFIQTTLSADPAQTNVARNCIVAVAQILQSPHGVLWRLQEAENRYVSVDRWPAERPFAPRSVEQSDPLCEFLQRKGWVVDLEEWAEHHERYDHLTLELQRYDAHPTDIIVPLFLFERLYGWLVLGRPENLGKLTFEERDLLKTAGRQIAAHLSQQEAHARLTEAGQFEAYSRLTAFVMHDLKNLAAQLRLISQNAERHKRNPAFVDETMQTIGVSAARMSKLIAQLTHGDALGTMQTADLAAVVERAALRCSTQQPVPKIELKKRPLVFADVERLASVIEHAIRNAQEATDAGGEVRVEVDEAQDRPVVRIVDTGCGMDESFVRDRLFRPFDTTKGSKGMGIGAFQIREYLRNLGGGVDVQSAVGQGTVFTLLFPTGTQSFGRKVG